MSENNPTFNSAIESAQNHMARAAEGARLLEDGKPLTEMKTPVGGPSAEKVTQKRVAFIERIGSLSPDELQQELDRINETLERLWNSRWKGTSEAEWRRIVILNQIK